MKVQKRRNCLTFSCGQRLDALLHRGVRRHLANDRFIELSKFFVLGHGGARVMGWPMLHLRLLIAVALLQAIAVLPSTAGKRVALVIGNSDYALAPLSNPKNDADDLAAKLELLRNEPDLAPRMGESGRKWLEEELGPDRHYERLMDLYTSVTGSSK